jgi:hypothetical protein
LFQWHHQPFAYFDNYSPLSPGGQAHLQDETNFFTDLSGGNMPAVSFIKPLGPDNEHPGYTNLLQGQQHVASIVQTIQNSPDWAHTAIIITYDENGGRWDHVTPEAVNGPWGDGTRVPTIVISPFAKKSFVDHKQHDTLSILKTIEERFNLPSLNNPGNYDAKASDLLSSFNFKQNHSLIVSVDGLRQADVSDPNLGADLTNIHALQSGGISYTNALTTKPSDSFPGALAYLTGATAKTTGVYYDDSYDPSLLPPLAAGGGSTPGTETQYAENVDYNSNFIGGGDATTGTTGADGNADVSSIDPTQLPRDPNTGNPVYPHSFVKVNTIFNVAHDAGFATAYSDKHPAYDIANGPAGNGVDEFFSPEINSLGALLDATTHLTVNADALLAIVAAGGTVDLSKYQLVDGSSSGIFSDPYSAGDPNFQANLELLTNNTLLTEKYDDFKVQALINEIDGKNPLGTANAPVPNLFGMNFQAVSVAEKYVGGGIDLVNGQEVVSNILHHALSHTDASIGRLVNELAAQHLYDSTAIFLTAKHGQDPRIGHGTLVSDKILPGVINSSGIDTVAQNTADDVQLLWLTNNDQTTVGQTAALLQNFIQTQMVPVYVYPSPTAKMVPASQVYDRVLWGASLQAAGLGSPGGRTPDIIVTMRAGHINVGGNPAKKYTFKRAEHGGFVEDDRHVPIIVSGGLVPAQDRGLVQQDRAFTTQIAVSALEALGVDPSQLQGAVIEETQPLTISSDNQGTIAQNGQGSDTATRVLSDSGHGQGDRSANNMLAGALVVRLTNLNQGVTLESANVMINGTANNLAIGSDSTGNPTVAIPGPVVSTLAQGQSSPGITLRFVNPSGKHVSFDAEVFSDPFLV